MTDYEPFSDFWGDFITGFAVTVIATQIETVKDTKRTAKSLKSIVDDALVFGSLHAINFYSLFMEWLATHKINTIISPIVLLFLMVIIYVLLLTYENSQTDANVNTSQTDENVNTSQTDVNVNTSQTDENVNTSRTDENVHSGAKMKLIQRQCFISAFLTINFLLFMFCSNSIRTRFDTDFCVSSFSYSKCKIHFMLKSIRKIFLILVIVLGFIEILLIKVLFRIGDIDLEKKSEEGKSGQQTFFFVMRRLFMLILITSSIALQAICSGYLLSDNFWQTKLSTALATVSITRLLNIYNYNGASMYGLIFLPY